MSTAICLLQSLPGQTWTQLFPTGTPPVARGLHGATGVYDPASNRMIVFGGRDGSGNNLNDVWVLLNANGLGGASQWVNLIPNGADGSPPARSGHSAVYDSANNVMIIFGGCSGYCTPALNDVWTLSHANGLGGAPVWTQLALSNPPPPRTNAVTAYDAVHNRLVLYGGQDGSPDPCSTFLDLWWLSDANGIGPGSPAWAPTPQWYNSFDPPPAPNGATATYSPLNSAITIFGGTAMVNGVCTDTNTVWQINVGDPANPSSWIIMPNGDSGSPPARSYASAVYDNIAARMLLFGGEQSGTALNDVWSLVGVTGIGAPSWTQLATSGGTPPARGNQAAVIDSANHRMAVFAGGNSSGVLNDSWVLEDPFTPPPLSCSLNGGAPNALQSEALTGLTNDLALNCTGGTPTPPGSPIPQYDVRLSMNTWVTSRLLPEGSGLSEALLIIDEAYPANPSPAPPNSPPAASFQPPQILCQPLGSTCLEVGTGGDPSPYQSQPNVFVGHQVGANGLTWHIPIDPPGASQLRIIRLTNLRANAALLGISSTFIATQIVANVGIQGSSALPVANSQAVVAISKPAIDTSIMPGNPIYKCVPHNASLAGGKGGAAFDFSVQLTETFSYAFQFRNYGTWIFGTEYPEPLSEQNLPGFPYRTQTGFYSPNLFTPAPTLGLADSGSRIRVEFQPFAAGTRLFVPVTITMTGFYGDGTPQGELRLIQANENGISASPGYKPVQAKEMVGSTPVAEVSYSGSKAYAIYEVVYDDPSVLETATIPVAVEFKTPPASRLTAEVTAVFAPISTVLTASATAPMPRFNGIAAPVPAYAIQNCPAFTPSVTIASKTGPQDARVWNIQVDSGAHAASGVQMDSLKLSHPSGKSCHPTITSPAFPVPLGDMPANSSATTPVTIDFTGCTSTTKFQATIQLSANEDVSDATVVKSNQVP